MIVPRMPLPAPDTPGVSVASCTKLRPFSGRSWTCRSWMTLPEHRRLGLEQRRPALDRDGFAQQPHRQLQVDLRALVDLQLDAGSLDLAKPRELDAQTVAARAAAP